jgi:hypothetical protein
MNDPTATPAQPRPWLLFIHQVPPRPDYLRVKVRRRLLRIGATQIKNTVYALPHSADALEDLHWIRREILAMGGTALICEASFLTPFTSEVPATPITPGTTWVTRAGVFIDRIASAWLIRRFIDPEARFHEGDRCTFQTLVQRFSLGDVALNAIGEIVRDIDCKAEGYTRPETQGVAALIRGIAEMHAEDDMRLQRGGDVFDVLHAALGGRAP